MFSDTQDLTYNTTLDEVKEYIKIIYPISHPVTKIYLKCWLYYSEGRYKGGKKTITFDDFLSRMRYMDYVQLIKSNCVVCDDLGTPQEVLTLLSRFYNSNEYKNTTLLN